MSLDADTNKAGLNALARAHSLMMGAPGLLDRVKKHINCPDWVMARLVIEMERHLGYVQDDLLALEALYEAMSERRKK